MTMKCSLYAFALLIAGLGQGALAANIPSNIPVTATIATLRSIPSAAGPQYFNVQVQDYYGTGTNCPIQYKWNSSDSRADDGGAVINPTGNSGNGRWNLNLPPNSPLHTCVYGVKVDSPASMGTGTDNHTQLQAALTWAGTYGPNRVHLDSAPGFCIKVGTGLTPAQGEIIEGDGQGSYNQNASTGSCVSYTGTPGSGGAYVFFLQTPFPGFGTVPFESPKFRDFTIYYFSSDTNPGGCIGLNSIAGGFTDDSTSQQPLQHPEIENVYCNMRVVNNSQKIGFFVAKSQDGHISRGTNVFGGYEGIELQGDENFTIIGPGTITDTFGPQIRCQLQGTFGNNTTIEDLQLLDFSSEGQSPDSMIYDGCRSSMITKTFFEEAVGPASSSAIHLVNGINANILGNQITTGAGVHWLHVTGTYNSIVADGNCGAGAQIGNALFDNGNYLYNTATDSFLSHYGNCQGDQGWPFNSVNGIDQTFSPKVEAIYSPNFPGLTSNGYGLNEVPVNSAFTLPITGSSNFLEFTLNRLPAPIGTFDMSVHCFQTTGTGQLTFQFEDGGSLVGSPVNAALTSASTWIPLSFAQVISTSVGLRWYNSGTGSAGNPAACDLIQIQDH